jgi:REP element-mobilizing transposase RayT
MPRRPRTDAPGSFHHVYTRRIERRDLFLDDHDRRIYAGWLGRTLPSGGATCFAWALQCNHVHLVVRTGASPLARLMHRVGTGFGIHFNRRYVRQGYVFESRYGARRIEDDGDLLNVVRYVHRNPIEAGVVRNLQALARYPWTGHAALMGVVAAPSYQAVDATLELFGPSLHDARGHLLEWMQDRRPAQPESTHASALDPDAALDGLVAEVCAERGISERQVRTGIRSAAASAARRVIAHRAERELGIAPVRIARALGVTRQALVRRLEASQQNAVGDRPTPGTPVDQVADNARPPA